MAFSFNGILIEILSKFIPMISDRICEGKIGPHTRWGDDMIIKVAALIKDGRKYMKLLGAVILSNLGQLSKAI